MKNIYEVLRQKENEIQQLQRDIEALRVAARILADDSETDTTRTAGGTATAPRVSTTVSPAGKPAETLGPAVGIRQFP